MENENKYGQYTENALIRLSGILDMITNEVVNEPDRNPSYYTEMSNAAILLASAISNIEKGEDVFIIEENQEEVLWT